MFAARKHAALVIDLTGPFEILSSEPSKTLQDDPAIDVAFRFEGITAVQCDELSPRLTAVIP